MMFTVSYGSWFMQEFLYFTTIEEDVAPLIHVLTFYIKKGILMHNISKACNIKR